MDIKKTALAQIGVFLSAISIGLAEPAKNEDSDYAQNSRRAVPRDAFPVLDNPKMSDASSREIKNVEPVIGLEIDGEAKAYPISVMGRHELVNDTCGGKPVAISW